MKNIEKIKPSGIFTNYIYKAIPLAFDESMSYYETLCGVLNLLKDQEIIVNNNADALKELQNYVTHYFDNLDVQEEINNKLDKMAESGELTDIIAQYLQLAGILAYNTVNDMKNATNLVNGSFAKTLGFNEYNDGKGAFYKIRTLTSSDVIDGVNIIAVNFSDTLIAEKMPDYYINELNEKITIQTNKLNLLTNKKYIFIGDSYGSGEIGSSWLTNLAGYMNLILNENYYNYTHSGAGFTVSGNTFETQLDNAIAFITDKNSITDIVVVGGYNDAMYSSATLSDIKTAISSFISKAKLNFPNCNVTLAHVGWTNDSFYTRLPRLRISIQAYKSCVEYGAKYINNIEYTLHDYSLFLSDGFHPSTDGNVNIAKNLVNGLLTGSCDVQYEKIITLDQINNGMYLYDPQNVVVRTTVNNAISTFEIVYKVGDYFSNWNCIISTEKGTDTYNSTPHKAIAILRLSTGTCFRGHGDGISGLQNQNIVIMNDNSAQVNKQFAFTVNDGLLFAVNCTNETFSNLNNIAFYPFKIVSDSLYC